MTTQMILMVVILLAVTYMFFSPRFPNAVVATIGAVAVGLIGTVQFKSIFTYYAGTSIVLMVGMMIVGGGMFHTGFAGWMGNSIVKLTGKGERSLQIIAILAGGIMSSVCSGSASLMILYPILSSICLASDISISRVLLPLFSGIGWQAPVCVQLRRRFWWKAATRAGTSLTRLQSVCPRLLFISFCCCSS